MIVLNSLLCLVGLGLIGVGIVGSNGVLIFGGLTFIVLNVKPIYSYIIKHHPKKKTHEKASEPKGIRE